MISCPRQRFQRGKSKKYAKLRNDLLVMTHQETSEELKTILAKGEKSQ